MPRPIYRRRVPPPVVYDPDAHREFVTGFRRRKQARRQQALTIEKEKIKEERRQKRQERRDVIKETKERSVGYALPDDGDADAEADDALVQHYGADDGVVVTTLVAPLDAPSVAPPLEEGAFIQKMADGKARLAAKNEVAETHPRKEHGKQDAERPSKKLPSLSSSIGKPKWRRRHISYSHTHHKSTKTKGRTTHSDRRKRQS